MRRLPLSTLLVVINVGLLILAVVAVAYAAADLLNRLADDQALAQAEQAGLGASAAVDRAGQSAFAQAQLLAERPTLIAWLESGDHLALAAYLAQFQAASQLVGAAVVSGDRTVASSGLDLDWAALAAAPQSKQGYDMYTPSGVAHLVLGASARLASRSSDVALVAVVLDNEFAQRVGREVNQAITLWPASTIAGDAASALRAEAAASGSVLTRQLQSPSRYVAVVPLFSAAGPVAGLAQADVPAVGIASAAMQLIRTLSLVAVVVGLAAAAINFAIGQRLGRPLRGLTGAAARIGYGDLSTPVPASSGNEIGTLADTLEEMRRRLLTLTADLRRRESESNAILAGIIEGVFTVDRERRIQYVNPQVAGLLGQPAEAIVGRFCGDVLNPIGRDGARPCEQHCPILHARFRSEARATEHLRLANGSQRVVVIASAAAVEDQSTAGEARQVQVMRDETEVEAARRLRDAVLANISHEFRTPLSAQLASIELLLDQLPALSRDQIGTLVISLQQGALRLTQLIDNLLESVRIEAGQDTIRRKPVAIDEVVEQALELTRPLLDLRHQNVFVDLPYPCPPVRGDGPRLTQVFVNLLANANKFAPAGTDIHVGGVVADENVIVWVEDHGPGLPQLPQQPLFVRFGRAALDEPEQGGVGLGLWIVKSIVERHAGRVEVDSSSDGTRLSVVLPIMNDHENFGR